jgi:hypothetical protein
MSFVAAVTFSSERDSLLHDPAISSPTRVRHTNRFYGSSGNVLVEKTNPVNSRPSGSSGRAKIKVTGCKPATAAPRTDEAVYTSWLPIEFAHSTIEFAAQVFSMTTRKTLLTYDQAEASPGVLLCAFCGKSNVNTSG